MNLIATETAITISSLSTWVLVFGHLLYVGVSKVRARLRGPAYP